MSWQNRAARARDRISRLAQQGLDLPTLWNETASALAAAVPHYMAPCWFTIDPATLLATSHYDHGVIPHLPAEWLAHEYYEDDLHRLVDVARSRPGISTLHEVTSGDPSRSTRWNRFVRPFGGDQELLAALRTRAGDCWGVLALYRERGQPMFGADELSLVSAVAPSLAEGARRALLVAEAAEVDAPDSPGLVVLHDDFTVDSVTAGADYWLSQLPGAGARSDGRLPPSVLAVAGQALRAAEGRGMPAEVAVARVRTRGGRWVVIHGATLLSRGSRRLAIIVEPTQPARISSLVMAAHGLTEREQAVTRLVLRGDSTTEIASTLQVSAQTVQQHLKAIFEKTGVRSRREIVGKVFFAHYEPRLRDNEARVISRKPLRGGPFAPAEPPSGTEVAPRPPPLRGRLHRR
jgi:DNA-binding CsgD family transcriptional regulator